MQTVSVKSRRRVTPSIPRARLTSPRPSLGRAGERAYRVIEAALVTLQIAPGSTISEAFLIEMSGFSRTAVREAIRKLTLEHLLVIKPKSGIYVTEIDTLAQLRLIEVRREIDRIVFQSAALRASPEQRHQFWRLSEQFKQVVKNEDVLELMRRDKELKELCLRCAENEFLAVCLRSTQGLSRRFWYRYQAEFDFLPTTGLLSADVAAVVANGKLQLVAEAAKRLVDSAESLAKRVASVRGIIIPEPGLPMLGEPIPG